MAWGKILGGSFAVCTFYLLLSLIEERNLKRIVFWYVGTLTVTILFNAFLVWYFIPPINGPFGGMVWLFWSFLFGACTAIFYIRRTAEKDRWGHTIEASGNWWPAVVGWVTSIITILIIFYMRASVPMSLIIWRFNIADNDSAAKNLAAMGNIQKVEYTIYPETDINHLNLLPPEVALDKVGQNWSRGGGDFATIYKPGSLVIQEIQGTLQYVVEPRFNNRFAYKQVNGVVPALFTVNAEDLNAEPKVHPGYEMRYLTHVPKDLLLVIEVIPSSMEVRRHLYFNGFSEYHLVDPTLELDENLQPYITVALAKPTYNFGALQLEGFVTVNAQTGEIVLYDPDKVAEEAPWVDRVYPDDLIEQYVTWWGVWADAPHFNLSGAGTHKIANRPLSVVYTDAKHPAWQIFLESRKKESAGSSTGVILCSTKHDECKFYEFLGLPVGSRLDNKFEGEGSRLVTGGAEFDARNIELHKIHGQPTFIGQYIKPEGSIDETPEGTMAGIVVAPAAEFQTADISFGNNKEEALGAYYRYLAGGGGSTAAPTEERVEQILEGRIFQVVAQVQKGATIYWVYLQGVDDRVFVAEASVERGFNLIPLSQPNDDVVLKYGETGENVVYLTHFENFDALERLRNTPVPQQ